MSDIKQVTEEELKQIKDLQDGYVKVTYDLGQIAIELADLEAKIENLKVLKKDAHSHLAVLRGQEKEISDSLNEKYGSSTIDLETGAIQ